MNNSFALNLDQLKQFCCYTLNNTAATKKIATSTKLKKSAVLLPFWHDSKDNLQIILTVRSKQLKHQPGQISFPGGKWEESDQTLINTAIRETYEEIAITKQHIQTFGILPELNSISGFEIHPVLGYVAPDSTWLQQSAEVDQVFCLPAYIALDIKQYHTKTIDYNGFPLDIYHLLYLDYDIWGATANILYRLALSYQMYKNNELSK